MIFTPKQINQLLSIIEYHTNFVIGTQIGTDVLTFVDLENLKQFGIVPSEIDTKYTPYLQMFLLGRLSASLSNYQAAQITYLDFKKYLDRGQYIPLSQREKNELQALKTASYGHIKLFEQRMKNDIVQTISEEDNASRLEYERIFREELNRGVQDRKSIQTIVSDFGNRLGKWNYDWNRLVDTEMNNLFQRGRSQTIIDKYGDEELVYKDVYPGACQDCIRLYLTNGIGSEPIVFKLKDLIANGSNVGRKRKDWKATLDGIHPHCRCTLQNVPEGYEWDDEKKMFLPPENYKRKVQRKSKVKVTVGDKVFLV